jgi:hypothetical protein
MSRQKISTKNSSPYFSIDITRKFPSTMPCGIIKIHEMHISNKEASFGCRIHTKYASKNISDSLIEIRQLVKKEALHQDPREHEKSRING